MNLFDYLNLKPLDFFYLALDKFLDINLPELKNFYKISPESLGISLPEKNTGRLLSHPATVKFIKDISAKTGHQAVIIPFKPSAKIELICRQNNWLLAANPAHLNRLFEDKLKFAAIAKAANLPLIDNLIAPFNQESFSQAQKQFGSKLVVQSHFGWAGNSTYSSDNYASLSSHISDGTLVKYSPYLTGYSLLNNCCLTSQGLIQSPPALQYTGLSPLTSNPFTTVGRQWPSLAPQNIIDQVFGITQKTADLLNQHHYRGFFGLDFLVSGNHVYLLECNPRLTASFGFYTRIEIRSDLNPLFLFHLAEFCCQNYPLDLKAELRFSNPTLTGSEITLKNSDSATIDKYSDFIPFTSSLDPVIIPPSVLNHLSHEAA